MRSHWSPAFANNTEASSRLCPRTSSPWLHCWSEMRRTRKRRPSRKPVSRRSRRFAVLVSSRIWLVKVSWMRKPRALGLQHMLQRRPRTCRPMRPLWKRWEAMTMQLSTGRSLRPSLPIPPMIRTIRIPRTPPPSQRTATAMATMSSPRVRKRKKAAATMTMRKLCPPRSRMAHQCQWSLPRLAAELLRLPARRAWLKAAMLQVRRPTRSYHSDAQLSVILPGCRQTVWRCRKVWITAPSRS
mmetsp:Transcript_105386/g.250949  ORF Transcript_105386/g.250949 Transcript_105386/m.250949 type:complete len:242 (+) Transcript_105386:1228-1953(+)